MYYILLVTTCNLLLNNPYFLYKFPSQQAFQTNQLICDMTQFFCFIMGHTREKECVCIASGILPTALKKLRQKHNIMYCDSKQMILLLYNCFLACRHRTLIFILMLAHHSWLWHEKMVFSNRFSEKILTKKYTLEIVSLHVVIVLVVISGHKGFETWFYTYLLNFEQQAQGDMR